MPEIGNIITKIHALITGRPTNFSFVDEFVCGSARPSSMREVQWLRRNEIRSILSLTVQPLNQKLLKGFSYHHVPIQDHSIPAVEQIRESVDFILGSRSKTLVHCVAGKGRTGVVLASYLCARYGLGPEEAIAQIRSMRPGSVESKQRVAIQDFYGKAIRRDT